MRQARYQRPKGATELVLVRHGESAPAVPGESFELVDGHGDPPLAPEGIEHAERVGERLAREGGIDAVYVTSLRRTVETAAPFLRLVGDTVPVTVEPDLREVYLGEWEGGTFRTKVREMDPIAVRMYTEERWDVIPGAEPADAFAGRVRGAITRIAAAHPDQTVVVVSHGGVIGQVLAHAAGTHGFTFSGSDNASISHVVVTDDRWIVRRYNDTAHLSLAFTVAPEPPT